MLLGTSQFRKSGVRTYTLTCAHVKDDTIRIYYRDDLISYNNPICHKFICNICLSCILIHKGYINIQDGSYEEELLILQFPGNSNSTTSIENRKRILLQHSPNESYFFETE
jgi:hypothetical protein